jgi:hypothetical protein
MKKTTVLFIFVMAAFWAFGLSQTLAQKVLQPTDSNGNILYVNEVIPGDTTAAGVRADSVFIFLRDKEYYFNGTLHNTGYSITLKAQDGTGSKPKLRATLDASGSLNILLQAGGNVYISNLYIDGMGNNPNTGEFDATDLFPGAVLQASTSGVEFFIDSSIVLNAGQVLLKSSSGARKVKVTNSIFANTGQLSSDNIGNGRFIDVRNHATDTIIVKNSTILNGYDNVLRHYNASVGSTSAQIQYIEFDHNTIYNFAGANGLFQLGNIVQGFKFTNNLLVDALSLGWDTTDAMRYQEYTGGVLTDTTASGIYVMHLIEHYVYANQSPVFTIANNIVSYDTAVTNYWKKYSIATPPYLDNTITAAVSGTTFTTVSDPIKLKNVPNVLSNVLYSYKANGYGYTVGTDTLDIDRHTAAFWLDSLDASYTTTNAAFKGTDGLPVGSNNWNSKVVTGVNKVNNNLPNSFSLSQNYPNPFNPTTLIQYSIPKSSAVSIKIYNLLGQEVATLVNQQQKAGNYSVNFNASRLASGIYMYRIQAGSFTSTKKMTLLK